MAPKVDVPRSTPPARVIPLGDRVLVRRDRPPETSASGRIHLPDTAKNPKKVATGLVLAVGEGRMPEGWGGEWTTDDRRVVGKQGERLLPGRRVTFSFYAGVDLPENIHDHELLTVLRSDEVVAVLEE
jgi:co-chaperonin GroES (HSP10)